MPKAEKKKKTAKQLANVSGVAYTMGPATIQISIKLTPSTLRFAAKLILLQPPEQLYGPKPAVIEIKRVDTVSDLQRHGAKFVFRINHDDD